MTWKEVAGGLASAAPVLGGALGGPVGAAAGAAAAAIASALGVEATPDAVSAALLTNPDAMMRIRELEVQERGRFIQFDLDAARLDMENTASARAREIALAQAGHSGAWATHIVALVITVGFFIMLYRVVDTGPEQVSQPSLILLGALSSAFGSVFNYYLGSSQGSTQKTSILAQQAAQKAFGEACRP